MSKYFLYVLALVELILLIIQGYNTQDILDASLYQTADGRLYLWTIEEDKGSKFEENYGQWIRLYHIKADKKYLVYENNFLKVYPWEIEVGDIDGDNKMDVYIGTMTKTRFYEWAKRPFFFSWENNKLVKKWTGSYIGFNQLESIQLLDYNGDDVDEIKLFARDENDEDIIEWYRWSTFGFYKIKE